jgi:hypothetical protein
VHLLGNAPNHFGVQLLQNPPLCSSTVPSIEYLCVEVLGEPCAGHAGGAVHGGGRDMRGRRIHQVSHIPNSVEDPEPDLQDPRVLGPPGFGSNSQRYGSGSFPFFLNVLGGLK